MEELITLYYGNLCHPWGQGKRFHLMHQFVLTMLLTELWRVRSSLMNWEENTQAGPLPTDKSGDSCYWSVCSTMHLHEEERVSKVPQRSQAEETEKVAPENLSVRTLLGATDDAIIQVAKQVYWGKSTSAPSMLSHHQHDGCIRRITAGVEQTYG